MRQDETGGKEKLRPDARPTVTSVRACLHRDRQVQLDDICEAFKMGMFKGKLVAQWCSRCGKWRPQYVPKTKVDAIQKEQVERPCFVPEPETFPCVRCNRNLKLIIDSEHTILETK